MNADSRLDELLSRWEQAREEGQSLSAEELCCDCPELRDEVKRQISILERIGRLVVAAGDTVSLPPTTDTDARATPTLPPSCTEGEEGIPHIPGYEVLGLLGRGGMGVVYHARQIHLGREVALKMILAGGHAGPAERSRFLAEARAVAALHHPGIVQVYECGTHAGLPFFALEFCSGGNLGRRLEHGAWLPEQAAHLVAGLARAVQAAHERGIVHRDLKPANVLLDDQDRAKVADFGLAKFVDEAMPRHLTRSGQILGTPSYMAPEQARGENTLVGPAADIYALGAILYECLTGKPPFQAGSAFDTILQVLHEDPVPARRWNAKVPPDLETICLKCLEKLPGRRYASARELAEELDRFLAGEPILARPVGNVERLGKWVRRRPLLAGMAVAMLAVLIGGTAVSTYFAIAARKEAIRASRNEEEATLALLAAEESLAAGLLRAIGHQEGQAGLNDFERDALEELAALPPRRDRVRILFIDLALDNDGTAGQLERRLQPALRAAVGLDENRRRQILDVVRLRMKRTGQEEARIVAARVAAALVCDETDIAREAASLLVPALGHPGRRDEVRSDLARLARRLTREDAFQLAQTISDLASREEQEHVLVALAEVFRSLTRTAEARQVQPLARRIAERILILADRAWPRQRRAESESAHLPDVDRAQDLPGKRVLATVDHGCLLVALQHVASRVDGPEAAGLGQRLLQRTRTSSDDQELTFVASSLTVLGRFLPANTARSVAAALFHRARAPAEQRHLLAQLAWCLPRHEVERRAGTLLRQQGVLVQTRNLIEDTDEEGAATDSTTRPGITVRGYTDDAEQVAVREGVANEDITRWLDLAGPAAARSLVTDLLRQLATAADVETRCRIVSAYVLLTGRCSIEETAEEAATLGQLLLKQKHSRQTVTTFIALAPRMRRDEACRQALVHFHQMTRQGIRRGDQADLTRQLAAWLPAQQVEQQAARLAAWLVQTGRSTDAGENLQAITSAYLTWTDGLPVPTRPQDVRTLNRAIREKARRPGIHREGLVNAFLSLTQRDGKPDALPRAEVEQTASALARALLLRPAAVAIQQGKRIEEEDPFTQGLLALAPYLDARTADEVASRLLDRLAPVRGKPTTSAPAEFRAQAELLGKLAVCIEPTRARTLAHRVLQRIGRNARLPDLPVLTGQAGAFAALHRFAPGDETLATALRLSETLQELTRQEYDPNRLDRLAEALEDIAPRLPGPRVQQLAADLARRLARHDGEASESWPFLVAQLPAQQTIDLLKQPTCPGEVETLILQRLLRLEPDGRADRWDVQGQIARLHPDLDLTGPPPIPRSIPQPGTRRAGTKDEIPEPAPGSVPLQGGGTRAVREVEAMSIGD